LKYVGALSDFRANDAALRIDRIDQVGWRDVERGMPARNAVRNEDGIPEGRYLGS
jgi:hypothetical protein